MITVYGIKNCDTIKKALSWLDKHAIDNEFFDYKKQSPELVWLAELIEHHGLDTIVNKRGTTYRKLDDATKEALNEESAPELLVSHPSMIKRPILCRDNTTQTDSLVGFKPEQYEQFFNE